VDAGERRCASVNCNQNCNQALWTGIGGQAGRTDIAQWVVVNGSSACAR